MPFYNDLRPPSDHNKKDYALVFPGMPDAEKQRAIEGLLRLRAGLRQEVIPRNTGENLLVASWNVKEFGHTTQRLPEAYFYIAETIARFDLVAIQEVKSTLEDLEIIMRLLGPDWSYLVNDITEGDAGNSERSAYLFNRKRVRLSGLAGEIVLWDELTAGSAVKQLKRTPYITGFKAGWKTFSLVNLHLHPGDDAEDVHYRQEEVRLLLAALAEKISKGRLWEHNLILVGDFNLYEAKDAPTVQAIEAAGYREVESLAGKDTNASKTEAYDRLFLSRHRYFQVGRDAQGDEVGGVFDPFQYVYRDGEEAVYADTMKAQYTGVRDLEVAENLTRYYRHPWRKNQLSDHFPIWFELVIDSSDAFLTEKLAAYA